MKSRVLGTLLALGLVTALTPATAFAAEGAYLDSFAPATGNTTGTGTTTGSTTINADTVATIKDYTTNTTTQYTSLADAINVADGKTIVLQKNVGEPVEVTKSITFAIDLNGHTFTGEITVPEDFTISKKTHGQKIVYTINAPIASDEPEGVDRVAGTEAPETSVKISETAFPDGSDWAIIASSADFTDAMSATGLAGTLDCPILTTEPKKTNPDVLQEIDRLGAKNVYIIGGKVALPADVEGDLAAMGVSSKRVYGPDAWDTSVACATKINEHGGNPESYAIISTSKMFQDALSMSSFAFKYKVPIFLTNSKNGLPVASTSAINSMSGSIFVAGGDVVVPASTAEIPFGGRVIRIAGTTGYDTSNEIATYMADHELLGDTVICIASGARVSKGLDALSGAPLAGKKDAPILLVNGVLINDGNDRFYEPVNTVTIRGDDSEGTEAFVVKNASTIKTVYILGGENAVSAGIRNMIDTIIK